MENELINQALDKLAKRFEDFQQTTGKTVETLQKSLSDFRRAQLDLKANHSWMPPSRQVVSDGCAKWLFSMFVVAAENQGKLIEHKQRTGMLTDATNFLGEVQKAALTTTDIPMPTIWGNEVVELIWKFGQFRQYATVYPLGALTTKLPKLATSPAFGVIAQSAAVGEKVPQIAFVTFTAFKIGGIVRIPSEIDADSAVPLGNFLARYIAREMARFEDTCGYMGDGTATYGSVSGIGKKADTLGNKVQLAATKSHVSDITIADLRTLRSKVDAAALANAAYYCHPTMESFFATLNNATNGYTVWTPNNRPTPTDGGTLDGFPVRWIGVMPVNDAAAHLNQYQVNFGDHSFWYFGERLGVNIQASKDIYFATDEIGIRALERFDIELMADAATAVLQLSAS